MEDLIDFLHKVGQLKGLKRTGWVYKNIPDPESVAEHSFRTAILALVLADELKTDKERLVKMALIHDLAESITGDLTPWDKDYSNKHGIEKKAIYELISPLKNGRELIGLWEEFEKGESKESQLVSELDKIEMIIQALEYEKEHPEKASDLNEFWESARKRLKNRKLLEILGLLSKKRKQADK